MHFCIVGGAKRINQRKSYFAFAQVISCRLADSFVIEVVKDIITYLETQSQKFHKLRKSVDITLGGFGSVSAYFYTALKQRSCLFANNFKISLFINGMSFSHINLVNFSYRQFFSEVGNSGNHTNIVCANSTSKSVAYKKITHKHCHMVVPNAVDSVASATFFCLIDHIIVDERSIVKQFYRCCSKEHGIAYLMGKKLSTKHNNNGAYLFAFRFQILLYNPIKQRAVAG